jgi:hypothetical protein
MPSGNQTVNLRISSVFEHDQDRIFESLPHSLFILDPKGNVLLSKSTPPATLGISMNQFLKSNYFQKKI